MSGERSQEPPSSTCSSPTQTKRPGLLPRRATSHHDSGDGGFPEPAANVDAPRRQIERHEPEADILEIPRVELVVDERHDRQLPERPVRREGAEVLITERAGLGNEGNGSPERT